MYQISFDSLLYCKGCATYKLIIAKIKTGCNSLITCNRVTVLALCTISDGRLSMYQVSFDSLLYFQRYAPDKFNIAKIRKGNNSINTHMGYGSCILYFPSLPSITVSSYIYLSSILLEICSGQAYYCTNLELCNYL